MSPEPPADLGVQALNAFAWIEGFIRLLRASELWGFKAKLNGRLGVVLQSSWMIRTNSVDESKPVSQRTRSARLCVGFSV
jgi:hypothetical protein